MIKKTLPILCLTILPNTSVANEFYKIYTDIRHNLYKMQYDEVINVVAQPGLTINEIEEIKSHPVKFGYKFPFLSSITSSLITELSYFESTNQDNSTGCLSVNGFGVMYQPVTVSLQFESIEQMWRVKQVKVDQLADYDRFYKKADCSK